MGSNAFVYHKASRSVFNDDCIYYCDSPMTKMGFLTALLGLRHDMLKFHHSMTTVGLRKTEEARIKFIKWVEEILADWDFEVLATAHNGVLAKDAKKRVQDLLTHNQDKLMKLAAKNKTGKMNTNSGGDAVQSGAWSKDESEIEC